MATMNLDTIIKVGLITAFILPLLAIVSATLPPPVEQPGGINISSAFNSTGASIYGSITGSYLNTSQTLLGNCGSPVPQGISNQITICNSTTGGSFYQSPGIIPALAFIISNLGSVITDIVQLPYLDYESINLMVVGMQTVMPGVPLGFLAIGADLLYLYMGFCLLLMAVGLIQKYNPKVG